ncbi:MAG: HAMP domain-containing protein, partial [Hyphomicrobiales bacterium]|nr:HAMP domain-containing protein [Hyphomicrobiales bacterium]
MAVQAKLFRTTVFKLALAFFAFSAVGAALVLANVAYSAKTLMDRQMAETIDAEIKGLSDQYAQGGIDALARTIDRRTGEPGAALYLLTDFAGERLSGNVAALPPDVLSSPRVVEIAYRRVGDPARLHHALARIFALDGGFRLLVGRDLEEREALRNVVARALFTSLFYLAAIGAVGGFFVSSRVLRRVDAMNDRARAIMHGDLDARLPVSGSGDEFDRLAANLNAMIERIGELMAGLKEVSDDIAHDLRTPLTRLRNRAEAAMRGAEGDPAAREALAKVIEESEGLIRVFDALLLIARAEVGAAGVGMAPFDAAEVVRSVAELYEPAAEEAGFRMAVDASALAPV